MNIFLDNGSSEIKAFALLILAEAFRLFCHVFTGQVPSLTRTFCFYHHSDSCSDGVTISMVVVELFLGGVLGGNISSKTLRDFVHKRN